MLRSLVSKADTRRSLGFSYPSIASMASNTCGQRAKASVSQAPTAPPGPPAKHRTLTAPSKSTALVLSAPPLPPAPAEKTTLLAPANAAVSSLTEASSSERSEGDAPVALMSENWSRERTRDVTAWVGEARRAKCSATCTSSVNQLGCGELRAA